MIGRHEFIDMFDIYEANAPQHHVVARMAIGHKHLLTEPTRSQEILELIYINTNIHIHIHIYIYIYI